CLTSRRAVGDALPNEAVAAVDQQLPPRDAAGDDDRACAEHVASIQVHLSTGRVEPVDRPGDQDLRAESLRLPQRPISQLLARDSGREAEVVLDPRGGPGLASRRVALDNKRAQSFRCPYAARR